MKKVVVLSLILIALTINACAPLAVATSTSLPATQPATVAIQAPTVPATPAIQTATQPVAPVETQFPSAVTPTAVTSSPSLKQYSNSTFGLSFEYPSSWFGPDEYVSGQTLRVEIGSDVVYPYGEPPDQPSQVKNSYNIVIQYSKNDQTNFWQDTYNSLVNLKDGESISTARAKIIRVRQLNLGRLTGFEYISTLSETAQTDPVYSRVAILIDPVSSVFSVLSISGNPNNVEVNDGANWREAYQKVDEANQATFHEIVESIVIK